MLGDDVEFTSDGRDVDSDYLDFALNEWDSYALEEALLLRDAHGGEVVAVSVGDQESEDELRQCLAIGADRAVRVWSEALSQANDPFVVARALAAALDSPDLVLCGAQSSDNVQGATGGALAGLLDLPCVAVVTKLEVFGSSLRVHRELEGGVVDVVEVTAPAVLTIQTGINSPRYVTLRAMKQVQDKEIEVVEPTDLGSRAYEIRNMLVPERKQAVSLGEDPAEVARRILALVREARS
jgi:electron transfer flavoprotein beta subunit